MLLTSFVLPDGWSCRSTAEIAIFAVWLVSYPCTLISWGDHHRCRFWFTFFKDLGAMASTLGLVIATQIGIFNKCSCYTRDGKAGLALPQIPMVETSLEDRLNFVYPAISMTGIAAQLLVFPGLIMVWYYEAISVFLQRDDGKSNLQWCSNISSWTWSRAQKNPAKNWMKKKHSICAVEGYGVFTTLRDAGQYEMERSNEHNRGSLCT